MGITATYEFDNEANFTLSNTTLAGGVAKLSLIPNPGQIMSQDFASDTGFTYDSAKAEFTGGLARQKDQRLVGAVAGGKFASFDLNWASTGSLTGTQFGSPSIVSGRLRVFSYANSGVFYSNAAISGVTTAGAIKIKYTPNYSGTPAQNLELFELSASAGNNDKMTLFHGATGAMRLTTYNNVGTVVHSAVSGNAWSPTAGTEYEIEFNFDAATGAYRVFVDGVLHSTFTATTFTRGSSASRLYIGAGLIYTGANAEWDDIVLFNAVQHTSGYTPGYSLADFAFAATSITLPVFEHDGAGVILSVEDATVTETGSPRYTIEDSYWNGSAWAASNGTYSQANSSADLIANLPDLSVDGLMEITVKIYFNDSSTIQSSVDFFEIESTCQKYSPTGYLEPAQALQIQEVLEYTQSHSEGVNTDLRAILKIDGVLTWWDPGDETWKTSDGTIDEANTAAEISDNAADLVLGGNASIYPRWVLSTDVDDETPEIETATLEYDFGGVEIVPSTCLVYGYLKDVANQPVAGAKIKIGLDKSASNYAEAGNTVVSPVDAQIITDDAGYFEADLIRSSELETEVSYKIEIKVGSKKVTKTAAGEKINFTVPDAETKDITDLIS